jgi:hypothetical protein
LHGAFSPEFVLPFCRFHKTAGRTLRWVCFAKVSFAKSVSLLRSAIFGTPCRGQRANQGIFLESPSAGSSPPAGINSSLEDYSYMVKPAHALRIPSLLRASVVRCRPMRKWPSAPICSD